MASGIYSYLPLGWRVLHKVERIIIEEMDNANAQQMLMPAMQPAELWQDSGRYSSYGLELIRFKDRHAQTQMSVAELLYQRMRDSNVDVLLDDRDERPGIKFIDSDLIGIPYRIVVGKHAEQGIIELKERRDSVQSLMGIDEALSNLLRSLNLD